MLIQRQDPPGEAVHWRALQIDTPAVGLTGGESRVSAPLTQLPKDDIQNQMYIAATLVNTTHE